MQFLVIMRDGSDAEALERRMKARPAHLEHAKVLKKEGRIVVGGPLMDGEGSDKMVGSFSVVDFPSRAELDEWLETDPYRKGDVWRSFEVMPIRIAQLD